MNLSAVQRLDESTTHVLEVALSEAVGHGDDAVSTEDLLLALAITDPVTGRLLADARILQRAGRAARPRAVAPADVLLALVTGQEPACEVLDALGVDLDALAAAARRMTTQRA